MIRSCQFQAVARMSRYLALCACLLVCWPPTALAAPLHPRQDDSQNPEAIASSNVIIISLSAVAAVILLASVIILIYFPSTRLIRRTVAPTPVVKPEINTTTTTTVTRQSRQDVENPRGSTKAEQAASGGALGAPSLERVSKIGLAISDPYDDDDDGSSSIYSLGETDLDPEKDRLSQLTRPPSSVLSRHSCHISAGSSDTGPGFPRHQRNRHFHRPISWLRLSTTTTMTPVIKTTIAKPQVASDPWSRAASPPSPNDLASRRGQPTLRHIQVAS